MIKCPDKQVILAPEEFYKLEETIPHDCLYHAIFYHYYLLSHIKSLNLINCVPVFNEVPSIPPRKNYVHVQSFHPSYPFATKPTKSLR